MKINIDFPFESEFYEFKTSLSELDKVIEAIAAMLNKHGRQMCISVSPITEKQ